MRASMFYCDRCGKLYDIKDFKEHNEILGIVSAGEENTKDLCPECEDDLERWFMDGKNNVRGGDDEDGTENSEVS